jgi:diguanylate cyclase (GGDEF)-like protein
LEQIQGWIMIDKKNILIVEDNIEIANRLKKILEAEDYNISGIVAFGEDAIDFSENNITDLILMDINLAGDITGFQAAELINTKNAIPIIFLTANDDKETLQQASKSNLYGFILKPFDENELKVTIKMAFYKQNIFIKQNEFYKNIEDLHETATKLHNCLSFDQIMKISTGAAHKFCQFDKYAVYKINYNELDYIAGSYKPSLDNYEFNYIKQIAELTIEDGLPFMFSSLDLSPIEPVGELNFTSCISSPVGKIGVFQFFSSQKNLFNQNHLRLIKLLLGHSYEAMKRVQLEQELRDQAVRDPLTNSHNRFYLYKLLDKEKRLAAKENRRIAFMMIDINNLKKINDNYGHLTGDKVIQIVASILNKEISNKDILIRYGGDEFLMMVPNPKENIIELEKKILERAKNWNNHISEFDFNISFAVGSKVWDSKNNKSLEDILTEVDEQMYINKQIQKELLLKNGQYE